MELSFLQSFIEFADTKLHIQLAGANCGNGPDETKQVMSQITAVRPSGMYLMAQANAGLPVTDPVTGKPVYSGTPEIMAEYAKDMKAMGINYIGACCGSGPEHIAAMRVILKS